MINDLCICINYYDISNASLVHTIRYMHGPQYSRLLKQYSTNGLSTSLRAMNFPLLGTLVYLK